MISYETFITDAQFRIKEYLPDKYDDCPIRIKRTSSCVYLVVVLPDMPSPYLCMRPYYVMLSNGKDMRSVLETMVKNWLYSIKNMPEIDITDYRLAKKHLGLRAVSDNDIKFIPCLKFYKNGILTWSSIPEGLNIIWGKTADDIYEMAEDNNKKEAEEYDADTLVEEISGIVTEKSNITIVSNKYLYNGCAHILSEKITNKYTDPDLRVVIPSIHYAVILKDNPYVKKLAEEMYKVSFPEDRLSDKVYRLENGKLVEN